MVDIADNTEDNKTVNDNLMMQKQYHWNTGYDTVATELEQRWYAFSVAKATKFTAAAMVMDDTADFDLYVYKLNETDGTLELVGGSAMSRANARVINVKA